MSMKIETVYYRNEPGVEAYFKVETTNGSAPYVIMCADFEDWCYKNNVDTSIYVPANYYDDPYRIAVKKPSFKVLFHAFILATNHKIRTICELKEV